MNYDNWVKTKLGVACAYLAEGGRGVLGGNEAVSLHASFIIVVESHPSTGCSLGHLVFRR